MSNVSRFVPRFSPDCCLCLLENAKRLAYCLMQLETANRPDWRQDSEHAETPKGRREAEEQRPGTSGGPSGGDGEAMPKPLRAQGRRLAGRLAPAATNLGTPSPAKRINLLHLNAYTGRPSARKAMATGAHR